MQSSLNVTDLHVFFYRSRLKNTLFIYLLISLIQELMDKSVVLIKNIDKTFKWNSEFKLKRSGLFIYKYMD